MNTLERLMLKVANNLPDRVLEPMERVSEILFGLIMVLTFTGSLSVAIEDHAGVRTMLVSALGCNLAWGIIDGGLYLITRLSEQGRSILTFRKLRQTNDPSAGQRIIAEALPPVVASVLPPEQLEVVRQKLLQIPTPSVQARLTKRDGLGAAGICLLVFLSTFPVVIPFLFVSDVRFALRISNAIAIVMMFLCGYAFARYAGLRPWPVGLAMVAIGAAMVGLTIALGG